MNEEAWRILEEAVAALRRNADDAAWGHFYRLVAPLIRGQLFLLGVQHPDRADDHLQDVLFRFLRYSPWRHDWRGLPPAPVVIGYLREIARNVCFDKRSRIPPRDTSKAQDDLSPLDTLPGGATTADIETAFGRWWQQLSNDERVLLNLLMEGHALSEIADLLGISYSAAGLRVHRLKAKLRTL
jgi:DNA-directed RNA polymerase specialized sigma24 family protein